MPFPPPPSGGFDESDVIWVFGHPRSGTTWFASLLRVGLGMKLWNEPLLSQVVAFRNNLEVNEPDRIGDDTFWLSDPQTENWAASLNVLLNDVIARQAGPRSGFTGLVIKEPNGSVSAPWLIRAMPAAKAVFVVRDIRDVVASLIDARKPGSWMDARLTQEFDRKAIVGQSVRRMAKIAERMMQVRDTAAEGHYYEMRYERLRTGTFDEMYHMAHHFGFPADGDQLRSAIDELSIENVPDEEKGPGKFIRKGEVGGWRQELEWSEVDFIQKSLADVLDQYGYDLVTKEDMG